jgi:hypothetical protein
MAGRSLRLRQDGQRHRAVAVIADEIDERAEAVFGSSGQAHPRNGSCEPLEARWDIQPATDAVVA